MKFDRQKLDLLLAPTIVRRLSRTVARMGKQISALDIGSGSATYWLEIARALPNTHLSVTLLDPHAPAILQQDLPGNLAFTWFEGIAPDGLQALPKDGFELVVAFDLIEHLTFSTACLLIYEIDRLSRNRSILYTPNGFCYQPPSENNPFNAHISGWSSSDLRKFGYRKIRGHTGFKMFFGAYGTPKYTNKILLSLTFLTSRLARKLPRLAFSISAERTHRQFTPDSQQGII